MSETFDVLINNMPCTIQTNMPLSKVLALFGAQQPYALLINHQFVPSSQHDSVMLKPDDKIDVISAIQGG
ncbi:MAG: sulfur carrier protein ThiS [Thiotrichales bacterium]|nr:sulfur carrier protein ThiS [Thiotrichales bacterium]